MCDKSRGRGQLSFHGRRKEKVKSGVTQKAAFYLHGLNVRKLRSLLRRMDRNEMCFKRRGET